MNKGELTKAVAEAADMSQAEAGRAVDAVFDSIAGAVKSRDSVAIAGFGTVPSDQPQTNALNAAIAKTLQFKCIAIHGNNVPYRGTDAIRIGTFAQVFRFCGGVVRPASGEQDRSEYERQAHGCK